jgi:hypothetical protein
MSNLQEIIDRKEDLHPDLKERLVPGPFGQMIQHPLIQEIFYTPNLNALYNQQYQHKTAALNKCLDEKNYHSYVFYHERPYRLLAFTQIATLCQPRQYWELLSSIWIDSENIWQNIKDWKQFLSANIPQKEYFMSEEDRATFNALPDKLTIHRGYDKSPHGLSYSLSRTTATWFANRFNRNGKIKTITIDKSKVFAYLNSRNEKEIIIL